MFIEIPATKQSKLNRRLILGVGINDADYMVHVKIRGKNMPCPFYKRWKCMIERCYSDKLHEKHPWYKECSVCDDWKSFMPFKKWMQSQDWERKELDKDIVITGNKIYSPETCIFVSKQINLLLNGRAADRGEWPKGVSFNKENNKFVSRCRVDGKLKHIGYFTTPGAAGEVYKIFKSKLILSVAEKQEQPLKGYLIRISGELT